ncbi:sensor domain-containing protein [Mycolicibacterium fortuitum]|uniref:sensor domain-containing protein n=1 Tax=Mycolicibacterium fortuitum TaxID=1766 RepID=UPI001F1C173A|nr:sensor domain-containing protein [Mycolicibacterium fortuitum]
MAITATVVLVRQVSSPASEPAPLSLPGTYKPPRPIAPSTKPQPEPEPNAIHAGQLGGILGLGDTDGVHIDAVLGVPYLGKTSEFFGLGGWSSDRPDCGGVLFPSLPQGYGDSGFKNTRMHGYVDTKPGETDNHMLVEQQATAFYTTAAATEFVTKAVEKWGECAHQVVTLNKPSDKHNPDEPYTVGAAAIVDGILTVTTNRESQPNDPWQCQHSLTSRRNVVIDVAICTPTG